ncbi:MAG: polyprenyl synthetase family protein [Cyclobacteriaceae bacterium]
MKTSTETIGKYLSWIEAEIRKQKYGERPASLYDPINYIMSLGGKRLRPLLVVIAYSLFKKDPRKIISAATIVESFHNFTLLHDDIMDNAPLRRGKPTVHERWNTNTAILAGDVMLVKVYEQLFNIKSDNLQQIIRKFNACAAEVCEGQQWDMEFENSKVVTEAAYIEMIKLKTAVLLGFSLEFGGLLANASSKDCAILKNFGIDIGIGFQLKDDLLDVYANKSKFGKQVGGDILANKKTYLLITALAAAKGEDKKELNRWLQATKFSKPEKIKAVTDIYNRLHIPVLTQEKVNFYFKRGLNRLKNLSVKDSDKKELQNFVVDLIDRIN